MITTESIIKQLKERGLKITLQRRAIIEVLVELRDLHPGARLVYEKAKKKKKSLSLSTAYATLNELSSNGIIKMLQFDRMENRYDVDLSDHINLICKRCGTIIDYNIPAPLEPKDIARKSGFIVTDTRMELHGYCRECLKRSD